MKFCEFEAAAEQRHATGIHEHRGGDATAPFRGDAAREGLEEAMDMRNYAKELYREGRLSGPTCRELERLAWEAAALFRGAD